ncbi:uncharacterized protein LOC126797041 [Argentina anserina]|uniref:uncharacterized protein LOC126797041 n=1 Tax=Argentina anserina TaxID=57926 RepID=UPI002176829C|nr:uncharacterized protein LOC126797041 [Potentilla anserina]
MNQVLLALYTGDEIHTALFQMHPSKAPRPDGMSPFFFQKYWDLLGDVVSNVLLPIAICNVVYKIASKVLANRLKNFLIDIVSLEHSAFVPDRLIEDNTLVATELTLYMHVLRNGQEGFMALKLHISKAYDRLEREFVKKIMLRLGFDVHWVDLIMHCPFSVRYSFLIYGKPKGFVIPIENSSRVFPYLHIYFCCVLRAYQLLY